MNKQTKLMYALEHIDHLYDLIEENEEEEQLKEHLICMDAELTKQMTLETKRRLHRGDEEVLRASDTKGFEHLWKRLWKTLKIIK